MELTSSLRSITAVPLVIWDIILGTIARLFHYTIMKLFKVDNAHVQFYHIYKNFEIAYGRLYGMLWNDKEGMKIVHRAALDKRIYTLQLAVHTYCEKSAISIEHELSHDRALCFFYSEVIWNRKNIKIDFDNSKSLQVFNNLFLEKMKEFKKSLDKYFAEDAESAFRIYVDYLQLEKIKKELFPELKDEVNPRKRKLDNEN